LAFRELQQVDEANLGYQLLAGASSCKLSLCQCDAIFVSIETLLRQSIVAK